MGLSEQEVTALVEKSDEAKTHSYSPYSKFRVGAALLLCDGTVITGCNVENASYGLTICAERTAICRAVAQGQRQFKAIAVSSDLVERHIEPCGACRQFISEFGLDIDVIMTKPDGTYKLLKISELLPSAFLPESLLK